MAVKVYTPLTNVGALLTSSVASYYTVPGATKARAGLIDLENIGQAPARVWVWAVDTGVTPSVGNVGVDLRNDAPVIRRHSSSDAFALALGYQLAPGQGVNLAVPPKLLRAGGQIYAMTDYALYGVENANILTTAEIVVAAGAALTYTATTVTDTGAAYTASANNADLVGRRIEAGTAYLIVTSNTATVITGSDGWRDRNTGMPYVNPNNGNLFPTSGGGGMGYTVLASMRDVTRTATVSTVTADVMSGHLITTGAYNARRTAYCAGNNASIATYGTTFQIVRDEAGTAGGWPTGTPTAGKDYRFDSKVRILIDQIEEA